MPRQEKRSRLRMLPPRVQLQQRDALTGSYPTNARFSIDGRTGDYNVNFNDRYSVVFTSSNTYLPGIGFPVENIWLTNSSSNDLTSSIVAPGNVRSQVVDGLPFFHFTPGQDLTPFRDNDQPAVDGKSTSNPFFATGSAVSDVGEGFSSPLWSKNKIEIDISVVTPTTLSLVKDDGIGIPLSENRSYPMAYYNFDTKRWDKIGRGYGIGGNVIGQTLSQTMIGFSNSFYPAGTISGIQVYNMGYYTNLFGFPCHPRFHATSSQTLAMSQYITEPFVLEKAVIEFSASWKVGSVDLPNYYGISALQFVSSSINSFFILNQRKNQRLNYQTSIPNTGTPGNYFNYSYTVPTTTILSYLGSNVYVDTLRDIVGFSQVYSFASGAYNKVCTGAGLPSVVVSDIAPITSNDIVLTSSISGISGANWSGYFIFSMSMCSPTQTGYGTGTITRYSSTGPQTDVFWSKSDGYRTGIGMNSISSRGYGNDYVDSNIILSETTAGTPSITIERNDKKHKVNPYILLPTDELIFGWQAPIGAGPAQYIRADYLSESELILHAGNFKITLYGSYIREGKEYNDGTNQLLSSDCIHEVIE